jgi:aspartate aminotransferase-like enzyme
VKSQRSKEAVMLKKYLLTPGPTPISPSTLLTMAQPIIHHRAPEYVEVFQEVREGLKYLFQTENEVLIFASSGTGAMEGAVTNTLCAGDKAIVIRGGKFGERWSQICQAYGVETINLDVEWGKAVQPQQVEEALRRHPDCRAVLVQASETSTGVAHPVRELGEIMRNRDDTILIVDAITGIGVFDIQTDNWGLDVVVSGSQKAIMLPPGLAFASVSEKAWSFVERSTLPRFYFDFKKELASAKKNQNAYTPAVSLIVGLREVLRRIREITLEGVFTHTSRMARATRKAVVELGMELLAPESPSDALTAIKAPQDMDAQKIVSHLWQRYGVRVAGGQDHLKGKIFRIAHMGFMDSFDVIIAISALEMTLKDLGYPVQLGKGVGAAQAILCEN